MPIGLSYLLLLLRSVPLYVRSSLRGGSSLGRPFGLVRSYWPLPFMDALTTPVLGGFILLLFGVMSATGDREGQLGSDVELGQGNEVGGVGEKRSLGLAGG